MPNTPPSEIPDSPDAFQSDNYIDPAGYVKAARRVLEFENAELPDSSLIPPTELSDYFFEQQTQVEQQGPMNYQVYANRIWHDMVGNIPDSDGGFLQFRKGMIAGLHNIDMKQLVYPDTLKAMPSLIEKYKDRVEGISLWSTGDVTATAYQLAKIGRSTIVRRFLTTLSPLLTKEERNEFVRNKTAYVVDDNKFDRLADYAEQHSGAQEQTQPMKLVIIEDSVKNFDKAQKVLDQRLGVGKAVVVPIWFTASREGQTAQTQADENEDLRPALEAEKERLNSIQSFTELLDETRFGSVLDGAHLMIDFDGVICDNVKMRERQAAIIYSALIKGASTSTGANEATLAKRFLTNLKRLTKRA